MTWQEIDSNLDALGGAASRLNGLARATGKEVDEQVGFLGVFASIIFVDLTRRIAISRELMLRARK